MSSYLNDRITAAIKSTIFHKLNSYPATTSQTERDSTERLPINISQFIGAKPVATFTGVALSSQQINNKKLLTLYHLDTDQYFDKDVSTTSSNRMQKSAIKILPRKPFLVHSRAIKAIFVSIKQTVNAKYHRIETTIWKTVVPGTRLKDLCNIRD